MKSSRYSLLKNPENPTESRQVVLERAAREDERPCRAYLTKERLRDALDARGGEAAASSPGSRLASACRSGVAALGEPSKKIRRREAIVRSAALGTPDARAGATSSKVELAARMGRGLRNVDDLVALAALRCSSLPTALPGRG